jgi:hypothetical protein
VNIKVVAGRGSHWILSESTREYQNMPPEPPFHFVPTASTCLYIMLHTNTDIRNENRNFRDSEEKPKCQTPLKGINQKEIQSLKNSPQK